MANFPDNQIPVSGNPGLDGGVRMGGPVAPSDWNDMQRGFYTHRANLGKGGWHSAYDIIARDSMVAELREFGMIYVCTAGIEAGNVYMLANLDMGGVDLDKTNNANWIIIMDLKQRTKNVIKKIYFNAGIKEEFEHGLNTGNLHISAYFNGHPAEVAINDVMENKMTATVEVSGLYTLVITSVPGFEYKNYACVSGTGVVITELINFQTESTFLPLTGASEAIMIDDRLYVILFTEQEIHELDPLTGLDIRPPINIGSSEYALRTDGKYIYTFGPNSDIKKIDIENWVFVSALPAAFPIGGVINNDNTLMWIVESLAGNLREIDLATFTYTGRQVALPNSAWGLYGIVEKQNYLYVTLYYDGVSKGQLHRVEKTGFTHVDSVDTPRGCGVPVLVDKEVVFPCYNDNAWVAVDVIANAISRNVPHNGVRYISNTRNKTYISGRSDTNISEYNLDTNAYTGRVNDVGGSSESNRTF